MLTGKKEAIITAFEKIGEPLDEVQIVCLQEVEQKLRASGLSTDFTMLEVKCRICGFTNGVLLPAIADKENIECQNCGNKTCQEIEDEEYPEDEFD